MSSRTEYVGLSVNPEAVIARPGVATDADVPVAAETRGALAESGLHRGGCPGGCEQRDEVLLVQVRRYPGCPPRFRTRGSARSRCSAVRGSKIPCSWVLLADILIVKPVSDVINIVEFCVLVTPADCGHDVVPVAFVQLPAGALAMRRPNALRKHARGGKAIVAGDGVVDDGHVYRVLQRYSRAIPTRQLFTIMLLVMETLFQSAVVCLIGVGVGSSPAVPYSLRGGWLGRCR